MSIDFDNDFSYRFINALNVAQIDWTKNCNWYPPSKLETKGIFNSFNFLVIWKYPDGVNWAHFSDSPWVPFKLK